MNKTLMKDYVFKVIEEYCFVKRVYFNYKDERVYFDLLVYSQKYRENIEYLLESIETTDFNKAVEKTIKDYLNQKGINYEKY